MGLDWTVLVTELSPQNGRGIITQLIYRTTDHKKHCPSKYFRQRLVIDTHRNDSSGIQHRNYSATLFMDRSIYSGPSAFHWLPSCGDGCTPPHSIGLLLLFLVSWECSSFINSWIVKITNQVNWELYLNSTKEQEPQHQCRSFPDEPFFSRLMCKWLVSPTIPCNSPTTS